MTPIQYPCHIRVPKHLSLAIKDTRKKLGMTQSDLADITDTSVKFISEVERGKETVQMDKVLTLARALDLRIQVTPGTMPKGEIDG